MGEVKSNGANLGFEENLWLMADKLRNNMDAVEYKHVVLCLLFLKYISDAFEEKYGFCKSATLDEVREHESILTPGRYVGIEETEEDGEPFEEKMTRLTGELAEMFARSRQLEEEIRRNLGAIGFEF